MSAVTYKSTLKPGAVETPLDLLFFRPCAYLFVRLALPTPLSANGMTILGILVGLFGASLFRLTDRPHIILASALTLLYAVLDCADGQLARARGTSSRFGRILDGMSDYIVGTASGIAISMHLYATHGRPAIWLAVGGLSSVILQGTLFDYFKNRYLALSASTYREGNDLAETRAALDEAKREGASLFVRAMYGIYIVFLRVQHAAGGARAALAISPEKYAASLAPVARGWAYLGPSTHVLVMGVFACAGGLSHYVWLRLTLGNALLLALYFEQFRRERALLSANA